MPLSNRLPTHLSSMTMVVVASVAGTIAITDPGVGWGRPVVIVAIHIFAAVALLLLDARKEWFTRPCGHTFRYTPVGVSIVVLLPVVFVAEVLLRVALGHTFRPLEQVAVSSLTATAFYLAATSRDRRCDWIVMGASFFLLLGAMTLCEHRAIEILGAIYLSVGAVGLFIQHWRRDMMKAQGVRPYRLPLAPLLCLMVLMGGSTMLVSGVSDEIRGALFAWVPSSGGTHQFNPFALQGVGDDGDWVVSGPNARSTGPVDSEYFIETDQPSIYDAIVEAYGEPLPPKKTRRAIAVDQDKVIDNEGVKTRDAGAFGNVGRQFTVYRSRRKSKNRRKQEVESPALFYIDGSLPLHLAIAVYGRFDGVAWHEVPAAHVACNLHTRGPDSTWVWLPERQFVGHYGESHKHQLFFGRLESERLPLPSHLERFRFGRNENSNVLAWAKDEIMWAYEGILETKMSFPSGTYLEVASRPVDRSVLLGQGNQLFRRNPNKADQHDSITDFLQIPPHLKTSAAALASRFEHLPKGWMQIEALATHLQTSLVYDRDATVPPGCTDPVHHLVHEARRGNDYQFATAAALALRTLGYQTRVVSGFYVGREQFDDRRRNAAVTAEHFHFWVEVRVVDGAWLTVDATPGYKLLYHRDTMLAKISKPIVGMIRFIRSKPLSAMAVVIFGAVCWRYRLRIRERLMTFRCLWIPCTNVDVLVASTFRLIELRGRVCGMKRPLAQTPLSWYGNIDQAEWRSYLLVYYERLYDPGREDHEIDSTAIRSVSRAVIRRLSIHSLREYERNP